MLPSRYRASDTARKLYATMRYLVDADRAGPIGPTEDRSVVKAAVLRHRLLLEGSAADAMAAYIDEERAQLVASVEAGRDVEATLKSLEGDLRETLESILGEAAVAWARWAGDRSPAVVKAKRVKRPDVSDEYISRFIRETAGRRIVGISDTSRKRVGKVVADGIAAGDTMRQIAARIERLYVEDIWPARATTIARTEVGVAVNWAQFYTAINSGTPMTKEWLALDDDRTRDDHDLADGQIVPIDEPFRVGDDELMFPMDESRGADADQIINCRCSAVYRPVLGKSAGIYTGDAQLGGQAAPIYIPSPAEFAATVYQVDSPDVITALAFAKGVFSDRDEWTHAREMLMKHVSRIRRASGEYEEHEHPREAGGRWTRKPKLEVYPSYSPDNARLARERAEWKDGTILRYNGGSKVALAEGEHVTVRGVYGMSEKTGVIYYNVETANGRRLTLASHTMQTPEPGAVPTPPTAKPPAKPKPPAPENGVVWSKPDQDGMYTVEHGGRKYKIYFDRDSGSWRSGDLINVSGSGGSPVDSVGFNREDVESAISSGRLGERIDRYTKPTPPAAPPESPVDRPRVVVTPRPAPPLSGDRWPAPSGPVPEYSKMSPFQMGQALQKRYPMMRTDLELLDQPIAARVAHEVDRLHQAYPARITSLRALARPGARRQWGRTWAHVLGGGSIMELNANFFNGRAKGGPAQEIMDHCVNVGWHPPACNSYEEVVSHEFGHVLQAYLNYSYPHRTKEQVEAFRNWWGTINSATGRFNGGPGHRAAKTVSDYARKNDHESFAEAFSAWEVVRSGRAPNSLTPGAASVGRWLEQNGIDRRGRAAA